VVEYQSTYESVKHVSATTLERPETHVQPGPTREDISVIICAYTEERYDHILEAISSAHHQTVPPLEVIVVVDHNPRLFSMLQSAHVAAVLCENEGEPGANGARNVALAMASSPLVAFLDDDACAEPTWIEALLAGFTDPQVMVIAGHIEPIWDAPRPSWFPDEFLWVYGCSYIGLPGASAEVRNAISCNMAARRQACFEIGGFLAGIGHVGGKPRGTDETEFCIRLRQRLPLAKVLYLPTAKVRHHVSPARTAWKYFLERCALEGESKANLVGLVGSDGISTERSYVQHTLPRGVARGVVHLVLRGDVTGVQRAWAICAGLTMTVRAFYVARFAARLPKRGVTTLVEAQATTK
jgi:GT2 family glycosyltransferase